MSRYLRIMMEVTATRFNPLRIFPSLLSEAVRT
jgi:hypothetical protein